MPNCGRQSIDLVVATAKECAEFGIAGVALFPAIPDELKTDDARER